MNNLFRSALCALLLAGCSEAPGRSGQGLVVDGPDGQAGSGSSVVQAGAGGSAGALGVAGASGGSGSLSAPDGGAEDDADAGSALAGSGAPDSGIRPDPVFFSGEWACQQSEVTDSKGITVDPPRLANYTLTIDGFDNVTQSVLGWTYAFDRFVGDSLIAKHDDGFKGVEFRLQLDTRASLSGVWFNYNAPKQRTLVACTRQ